MLQIFLYDFFCKIHFLLGKSEKGIEDIFLTFGFDSLINHWLICASCQQKRDLPEVKKSCSIYKIIFSCLAVIRPRSVDNVQKRVKRCSCDCACRNHQE